MGKPDISWSDRQGTTAAVVAAGWGVTTTSKALQGGAGKKLAFKTKFDPRLWLFGQLSGMVCGQQPSPPLACSPPVCFGVIRAERAH